MRFRAWVAGIAVAGLSVSTAEAQGRGQLPKVSSSPTPVQMIVPPVESVPGSLKGKSLRVVFTVDSIGHVSNVTTIPTITDSVSAKRFADAMRGYRFTPAKDSTGKAVGGDYRVDITFKN